MSPIDGKSLSILDLSTLAKTIYGEARGSGERGMVAVACVMRNRMHDHRWPHTMTEICLQPMQLSCWNDNDPNREVIQSVDLDDPIFCIAFKVAVDTAVGGGDDITNGANHYMTIPLFYSLERPEWAQEQHARVVAEISGHVFLRA